MGNLINPLSFRLGVTKYWNSNWSLSSSVNYSFLSIKNILLIKYIEKLFYYFINIFLSKILVFINLRITEVFNNLFLIFYFKFDKFFLINSCLSTTIRKKLKKSKNINFKIKNIKKFRIKNFNFLNFLNNTKFRSKSNTLDKNSFFVLQATRVVLHHNKVFNRPILNFLIILEIFKYVIYKKIFKKLKLFLLYSTRLFWKTTKVLPSIIFNIFNRSAITAILVARFVTFKLQQKFPVRKVINSLLYQMRKLKKIGQILGFKITCSGRFARRGRASYIWEDCGKISNSVLAIDVDYTLMLVTLVNSICGVKVWIVRNRQTPKLFSI